MHATNLERWKYDGLYPMSRWVLEKLASWKMLVLENGEMADPETGKRLRKNHLRCMLKAEYKRENKTEHSGKQLELWIDRVLDAIAYANSRAIAERKHAASKTEIMISDDYL
jgi:hypothetical protein